MLMVTDELYQEIAAGLKALAMTGGWEGFRPKKLFSKKVKKVLTNGKQCVNILKR